MENQFQFIGNLTRDPETKKAGSTTLTELDIACNNVYYNADSEKVEEVDFFRIKAFGKVGEPAGKHLAKGAQIFVKGRIKQNNYEKDGQMIYSFEFIAESVKFLGKKVD